MKHPSASGGHGANAVITRRRPRAFTLIELLVVISIISLLVSILLPSLSRAKEQAKGVHCLARLKEFGTAFASYENVYGGNLPPCEWFPSEQDLLPIGNPGGYPQPTPVTPVVYGWAEVLYPFVYQEPVNIRQQFPAQRQTEGKIWQKYLTCATVGDIGENSGHYRVYLPFWSGGAYRLKANGVFDVSDELAPRRSTQRERLAPRMPLIGDANEFSERGDGVGNDDTSYIDAGEANIAGTDGRRNGNRFSDRHYGGTNYLFQDLHAEWNTRLREDLSRDYDLNGIMDVIVAP